MAQLCQPDKIVWLDGSLAEKRRLEKEASATGEIVPLNPEKWPNCFFHRTAQNDVARTEHLTYICTPTKEEAGPTNNWMAPQEAYQRTREIYHGSMKGRTMYVIPFSMGRPDSSFSKIGVQLTDSIYVVLNMWIMTYMGADIYKKLGSKGEFTKCLHSKADLDENRRLILHFPQDNTIWSVGSGYGGNALLGKKCLSLRIASSLGQKEGWMAEHMLIMGIEDPEGQTTYVAAAFPSACGKTNLAMLVPPEEFKKRGYKVWTIGDDIAWMRLDEERALRAINPETGMFGVATGTNSKTNPNALATVRENSIFTNVVFTKDNDIWWEGMDGAPPSEGLDWRGQPWHPGLKDANGKAVQGAHPNSRFTAPIKQCPSLSKKYFDPKGVKISALIFGGRRAHLQPLVYEARNWQQGVFLGAAMASERTAAQFGKLGEVRRDPMAMIPFCGYNMGRYFQHWLDMGKKMAAPPKIFHVNWFRQDENGSYLWPGYGENMRVLLWIIDRCRSRVEPKETPIGLIPHKKDINLKGLDISDETWDKLFGINVDEWKAEIDDQTQFFSKFNGALPPEIWQEQTVLKKHLGLSTSAPDKKAALQPA